MLGNVRIGTGTPGVATTAGSLYVTGPSEFANSVYMTGAPAASGTAALAQFGAAPVGGSANGQMAWINAPVGFAGYYLGAQTNGAAPSFLVAHNALTVGNGAGNAGLVFNGGAGSNRDFTYQSGGVTRWLLRVSATAESGSNAGSDFQFIPFSDTGTALPTAITMKRSTSDIIVGTNLVAGVSAKFSNIATAANTTDTTPTIYATTTTGGAYPFLTAGNLVYQTRPSGANRDHVFVGGTTQAVQAVINGTGLSVGTAAAPVHGLDLGSSMGWKVKATQTGTYTAASETIVPCDPSAGGFTVNLPALSGITGRIYVIKNTTSSTNTITIDASGAETIDGAATKTITTAYGWKMLYAGTTEWRAISESSGGGSPFLTPYTTATLPASSTNPGDMVYVTDLGQIVEWDGKSWRVQSTRYLPPTTTVDDEFNGTVLNPKWTATGSGTYNINTTRTGEVYGSNTGTANFVTLTSGTVTIGGSTYPVMEFQTRVYLSAFPSGSVIRLGVSDTGGSNSSDANFDYNGTNYGISTRANTTAGTRTVVGVAPSLPQYVRIALRRIGNGFYAGYSSDEGVTWTWSGLQGNIFSSTKVYLTMLPPAGSALTGAFDWIRQTDPYRPKDWADGVVDMSGDVTGMSGASRVARIQGYPVPVPASGDTNKYLQWNNTTLAWQFATPTTADLQSTMTAGNSTDKQYIGTALAQSYTNGHLKFLNALSSTYTEGILFGANTGTSVVPKIMHIEYGGTQSFDVHGRGEVYARRLSPSNNATALVAGDFTLTGWGASAVATVTAGSTDMAGSVTITTNAADTPSANPTVMLTFKDGAWKKNDYTTTQAPFVTAVWDSGSTGPLAQVSTAATATTTTFRYNGTPTATASLTYTFTWHTLGSR